MGTIGGEGVRDNTKRVHRHWREQGPRVPAKQRTRRRPPGGENGCTRKRAEYKDHIWSYDFVVDRTDDGRRPKMMPIVDEYTRECLSLEVGRTVTAEDVLKTLAVLFDRRGELTFIRSDNGGEFIAKTVKRWLETPGVKTLYIEPGSHWENASSSRSKMWYLSTSGNRTSYSPRRLTCLTVDRINGGT